jgi:SanA protein
MVNVAINMQARPYMYKDFDDVPKVQTVLIPGAALAPGGVPSPVFEDRVKAAIKLYEEKKVSKILVSGDNSTVFHNEVNPVRDYLLREGIPSADIFLDHAGFDTYSSMYRARDIFKVSSVVVASQAFHLPRTIFIGRSLGVPTYGFVADKRRVSVKNYLREILANEKAILNIFIKRQPKYLGDEIPITGEGE